MADDAGRTFSVEVPDAVGDWLAQHRDDPATAAAELLVAQRSIAEDPETSIEPAVASVLADRMDAIADAVAERLESGETDLEERVGALETNREAGTVHDRIAALESDLADQQTTVNRQLAEFSEKLDRLAWAVLDGREQSGDDPALDRILSAAHAADVNRAACADCGRGLDLGLLTGSRCPHCEADFADLDPPRGWFGTATLVSDAPEDESSD